jgi:redox-sensitive bicupin YhaK (pirin superfamily)
MNRRIFNKSMLFASVGGLALLGQTGVASASAQPAILIRRADARGVASHGWLESRHTFSFADYFDPAFQGFSDLRVINEDRVQAGRGFGKHPHRDMEIFSYVLEGQLAHQDSMGNGSVVERDDVQVMSAGTGVYHSEFNPSATKPVHFLQIWVKTNTAGADPTYAQKRIPKEQKRGRLQLILSEHGEGESLRIRQDVKIYAGLFDANESARMKLDPKRALYVHVARGTVRVNGEQLNAGDGLMARNFDRLTVDKGQAAEILVFDLRG